MTNLETALNNADVYVKENYLPEEYIRSDFKTMRDILYRQQGSYIETKDEIKVTLDSYDQEPAHQMLAAWVCQRITDAQLYTTSNKRLTIEVATT
jgi:hypothetical protein